MAKIIKKEKEELKMTKLIGKKFQGEMNIPKLWQDWFDNDEFKFVDEIDESKTDDSYLGLMRYKDHEEKNYEYWIGIFVSDEVAVPAGYESLVIPSQKVVTYYIKGHDNPNLYQKEGECFKDALKEKVELASDKDNYHYVFERYNCPRFTEPDKNNEVILDYCLLIK